VVWSVGSKEVRAGWLMVIATEEDSADRSALVGRRSRQLKLKAASIRRGGEGKWIPPINTPYSSL
jgi:hypothetical protein